MRRKKIGCLVGALLLVTVLVLLGWLLFADGELPPADPRLVKRVATIVERLIATRFTALRGIRITYCALRDAPSVFLETSVKRADLFSDPAQRRYLLFINDALRRHPPTDQALEGILAHELCHFQDYRQMSGRQLIGLYLKVNLSARFVRTYERGTDLKAMQAGFAAGLKAYRRWLYRRIKDPADLALKRQNYYTPDEIDAWLKKNAPGQGH